MSERTARRTRPPAQAKPSRRRRPRLPVRPGVLAGLVVLGVVAFLYARPIASYVSTSRELAARQAEVAELRAQKLRVTEQLQRSTSVDALERDARRIGQVRPGEQLFIVKGIDAWRRAHAAGP